MKYNHLNVPSHWQNYWTRFPEGHTILEALISWVSQVDDMVDNQNKLNENVEQFRNEIDEFIGKFDGRLQDEVENTLKAWQKSGFLDVVITDALQWQLDEYITTNEKDKTTLTRELAQTNSNKADITYVEQLVNDKASGTPKIVVSTFSELPPIGGAEKIALVLDTGKLYYDNGTTWVEFSQYQDSAFSDIGGNYISETVSGALQEVADQAFVLLKNLTTNGNLAYDRDSDGYGDNWYYGGANTTEPRIANNTQFWTPLAANTYSAAIRYNDKPIINGHVYYVSWEQTNVMQVFLGQGQYISYDEGDGLKEKIVTSSGALDKNIMFFPKTANVEAGVKNLMVFDLTETFGAGKEPSLSEIKEYIQGWLLLKNVGENRDLLHRLNLVERKVGSELTTNNLIILGDSITETATMNEDGTGYTGGVYTNWPTHLSDRLNINYMKNYARSGATFKDQNIAGDRRKSLSEQVKMLISNSERPDIIVVSIGTNDGIGTLGNYDTAMAKTTLEALDRSLLYEAIRWNFWKLRENYPEATFFCATPIQRTAYEPPTALIDAIVRMANRYNFIVIDALNESGIVRDFEVSQGAGRYLRDGLHPNEAGKRKLANLYSRYMLNALNY